MLCVLGYNRLYQQARDEIIIYSNGLKCEHEYHQQNIFKKFMSLSIEMVTERHLKSLHYLAGTAFHSSQNVMNDDVTKMMPGMNTVVK
jgi:hypothetical protein